MIKRLKTLWHLIAYAYAYRDDPEYVRFLSVEYWRALLLSSVFVLTISLALGFWMFTTLLQDPVPESSATVNTESVHKGFTSRLRSTLTTLEARAVQYEWQRTHPPTLKDPSR